MKRKVLTVFVLFILGLTAVFFAVSGSSPVNAQAEGQLWLSSAEPPAGITFENLSPPDGPNAANQEDVMEGGGLISWRVTGAALKPRQDNTSYTGDINASCTYVSGGSASTVWNTPIHLLNGSVVDTLRMYYYDPSALHTPAWFPVYDLYGTIVNEGSVSSSISGGNSLKDSAQMTPTIDYSI
jgi:hypothetical protein